jgi:hypothetical protein
VIDERELGLLRSSALNAGGDGRILSVITHGCAFSCCGRGWQRRDGYEQTYKGWIDNLRLPEGPNVGSFMLYSPGLGTLSYVVAMRFDEVEYIA